MQEISTTQSTNTQVDVNSRSQDVITINGAIALVVIFIPITIFAGLRAYKKYRTAVFRQQIKTLEKLWRLDANQKKS